MPSCDSVRSVAVKEMRRRARVLHGALLALAVIVPAFITNQYYIQVLSFIGIYIILSLSLNLQTTQRSPTK